MQHFEILERAWKKTWRYRALWIFGLLVALTAGGSGGSGGGSSGWSGAGSSMGDGFSGEFGRFEPLLGFLVVLLVIFAILFVLFLVIFGLLAVIARYVGESALIQLVDREDATGVRPTLAEGFDRGWSLATLRLFIVKLVVSIPVAVISVGLILLSGTPLLLWVTEDMRAGIVGTVLAVGLFLLSILFIVLIGVLVKFFQPFYQRRIVLADRGVFMAIGEGVPLVLRHVGDVLLMWLIMIVVNILGGLALAIASLALVLLTLLIVGAPALLVGWLLSGLLNTSLGYLISAVGVIPWFFGLVIMPSLLLGSIFEVFKSTVWTLTYRELLKMDSRLDVVTE